jgi:UDP-N-acetylglucosamine acyltransferase
MSSQIHPTAIVSPGAQVGHNTTIGPYSVIGPNVKLGADNQIGAHVVIDGHTTLGSGNKVFPFAAVGTQPQDLKYHGEPSTLEIGDHNLIREYVTLQPGTEGGGMRTVIGNRNLFMANSHVGHDSFIGDENVFANSVGISGHVTIGNRVTIGGLAAVHQFVRLGDICFVGGGSMVVKDVPPYCIVQGDRAALVGLNKIGLERKGYTAEEVEKIKRIYRELFVRSKSAPGNTFKDRVAALLSEFQEFAAARAFLEFIVSSERGVCFPARGREE